MVTISKRLTKPPKGAGADEKIDQRFEEEMIRQAHQIVKEKLKKLKELPEIL